LQLINDMALACAQGKCPTPRREFCPIRGGLVIGSLLEVQPKSWHFPALTALRLTGLGVIAPSLLAACGGGSASGYTVSGKVLWDLQDEYNGVSDVSVTLSGDLNFARRQHTATLLPNGKVMVFSGNDSRTIELWDPVSGGWTPIGFNVAARPPRRRLAARWPCHGLRRLHAVCHT